MNFRAEGVNDTSTGMRTGPRARTKDTTVATKDGRHPSAAHRSAPLLGTFRAFWPITDDMVPLATLINEARADLPWLASQAHARIRGKGKWTIQRSADVPGSGRVTELVLMYDAPAESGRNPFADSKGEVA